MSQIVSRQDLLLSAIVLVVAMLMMLIPLKWLSLITTPFSMRTFGIRKIKRWHSRTDTLGNLMLWISLIFCVGFPWIPYSPLIYLFWLTFTWLCTVSRAVRMSQVRLRSIKIQVIFLINLIYGVGILAGFGFYNDYVLWVRSYEYANLVVAGEALQPMLYLTNSAPAAYLVQVLILAVPVMNLWGQFKYMRLENTFKAANMFTYWMKSLLVLALTAGLGIFGGEGLHLIYQHQDPVPIYSIVPMERQDLEDVPADAANPEDQAADPNAGQTDPNADPNAQQTDPNVDPNAQPADPNADPNAQPADPNAQPADPNPEIVDPNIDPNAVDPYTAPVDLYEGEGY